MALLMVIAYSQAIQSSSAIIVIGHMRRQGNLPRILIRVLRGLMQKNVKQPAKERVRRT